MQKTCSEMLWPPWGWLLTITSSRIINPATKLRSSQTGLLLVHHWPPQSPDINPADHRWDVVEQEVLIQDALPNRTAAASWCSHVSVTPEQIIYSNDVILKFLLHYITLWWLSSTNQGKTAPFTGSTTAPINCLMKEPSHYKCHQNETGETFGSMRAVLRLIHGWTVAAACGRQVPASTSAGKTDLLAWFCSDDVSKNTWQ